MEDQARNIGHAARLGRYGWAAAGLLGILTGAALLSWGFLGGLVGGVLLAGCLAGWLTLGGYALLHKTVIDPVGDALGRVIVPSGSSTPSAAQHSNIEALEARGRYAEAAAAYRAAMAADPSDVVACEKLAQLSLRVLRDYDGAITAYREAERRAADPRRKQGFALLVANLYRDNVKDWGRAVVELRRILETYPDVPHRAQLASEIDELKRRHFGAS